MKTKLTCMTESFRMAGRPTSEELPKVNADLCLIGHAIDERGHAGVAHAKASAAVFEVCEYDVVTQQLQVGSHTFSPDLVQAELQRRGVKKVLLECTTLGTAEIALFCRALAGLNGIILSFLYVEPKTYPTVLHEGVIHRRDFELSTRFHGFSPVPGMCYQMDEEVPQTTVLLLGFEGDRAQRAFEELKIAPSCISAVFGVPAYQPGWEYDAFANNLVTLGTRDINRGVHFCGADNPKATLQYLSVLRSNYPLEDTLFVAPLGPKPQALGAVLFAAFSDRVGLLYDFPVRKSSRSKSIAKWHLFQAQW